MKKILFYSFILITLAACSKDEAKESPINKPPTKVVPKKVVETDYGYKGEDDPEVTTREFDYNENTLMSVNVKSDRKDLKQNNIYDSNNRLIKSELIDNKSNKLIAEDIYEYDSNGHLIKETSKEYGDELNQSEVLYTYENGRLSKKRTKGKYGYSFGNNTIDKKTNDVEDRYTYPSANEVHIERCGYFDNGEVLKIQEYQQSFDDKKQLIKEITIDVDIFSSNESVDDTKILTYDDKNTIFKNTTEALISSRFSDYVTVNNVVRIETNGKKTKFEYEYNSKGYPTKVKQYTDFGEWDVPTQSFIFSGDYKLIMEQEITYYNE